MTKALPYFKYHPDPLKTGVFKVGENHVCDCCEQETDVHYVDPFYDALDDKPYLLCPTCIANGAAHERFKGVFHEQEMCDPVSDASKLEELCFRTPGFGGLSATFQPIERNGETVYLDFLSFEFFQWLAHCDDYCTFLGAVGWAEIAELGLEAEIKQELLEQGNSDIALVKAEMKKKGRMQGYLFQCLHCKKYRLYIEK